MDRTRGINAQVRATKSRRHFLQRTPLIHPIGPQTHILGCFTPVRYCTNFGVKWGELVPLMHKSMQRGCVRSFLQRAALIHAVEHQTHVLGHFGLFCYCTNFGAKQAELVQLTHKFIGRSRVGIFRNKCIRSTPLDPKLMF
jgi:hypothetical protein